MHNFIHKKEMVYIFLSSKKNYVPNKDINHS